VDFMRVPKPAARITAVALVVIPGSSVFARSMFLYDNRVPGAEVAVQSY
jgi:hypothetical protein